MAGHLNSPTRHPTEHKFAGLKDNLIVIYDADAERVSWQHTPKELPTQIEFAADGNSIFYAGKRDLRRVYIATNTDKMVSHNEQQPPTPFAVTDDFVALRDDSSTVSLIKLSNPSERRQFVADYPVINKQHLLTVTIDGGAKLYSLPRLWSEPQPLGATRGTVASKLSTDGKTQTSISEDAVLYIYDPTTGSQKAAIQTPHDGSAVLDMNNAGTLAVTSAYGGQTIVWDLIHRTKKWVFLWPGQDVESIQFSANADRVVARSLEGMRIWDMASGGVIDTRMFPSSWKTRAIAITPRFDGALAVPDNELVKWTSGDASTPVARLPPLKDQLAELVLRKDGKQAVVVERGPKVHVVDLVSKRVTSFDTGARVNHSVQYINDTTLAVRGELGRVRVLDLVTGEHTARVGAGAIRLSMQDNQYVLSMYAGGTVVLPRARSADRGESFARARAVSHQGELTCLIRLDGGLEGWLSNQPNPVFSHPSVFARRIVAQQDGCWTTEDDGHLWWTSKTERRLVLEHVNTHTLIDSSAGKLGGLWVGQEDDIIQLDVSGKELQRLKVAPDAGIVLHAKSGTWVSTASGNILNLTSKLELKETGSRSALALFEGPNGIIIGVAVNGLIALWDPHTGARLETRKVDGWVSNATYANGVVEVERSFGRPKYRWDVNNYVHSYCDIMRDIWANHPLQWSTNGVTAATPPAEHECLATARVTSTR